MGATAASAGTAGRALTAGTVSAVLALPVGAGWGSLEPCSALGAQQNQGRGRWLSGGPPAMVCSFSHETCSGDHRHPRRRSWCRGTAVKSEQLGPPGAPERVERRAVNKHSSGRVGARLSRENSSWEAWVWEHGRGGEAGRQDVATERARPVGGHSRAFLSARGTGRNGHPPREDWGGTGGWSRAQSRSRREVWTGQPVSWAALQAHWGSRT